MTASLPYVLLSILGDVTASPSLCSSVHPGFVTGTRELGLAQHAFGVFESRCSVLRCSVLLVVLRLKKLSKRLTLIC